MTRSCSALGCTARDNGRSRERGISFHQFPVDAAQRREWIRAVNRVDPRSRQTWRPGPGAILCSRHFAEADFERYGMRRKLRRGAVPSRFPRCPRPVRASAGRVPRRAGAGRGDSSSPFPARSRREPAAGARPPHQVFICFTKADLLLCGVLSEADLPCALHRWMQMAEYSLEMRQFACVLHLYHTKAYDYLRKIFPLPHPYSLTKQVFTHSFTLSAAAGFSNDIFLRLQEKVEREEQDYRHCALMIQDVSLQKQQEWDPQSQSPTGFVDLGAGGLDADEAPLASEAIVIMAVGISSPWTAPLGYFFVNSATGHLLAQLLRHALNKLNNVGVTVLAVTSGATACGAETARALGIRMEPERSQCTFRHPPSSAHSIAYFFNVHQALQLIRNALQCFRKIEGLGDTVEWQHVVELAALREQRVLEPCSPKSGRLGSMESYHLKVNLATRLFSEDVADALEHLRELGLASFQNCSGTVKFVRFMSCLCDVFHGRGSYRRGLAGNYSKISQLFDEAKSSFVTLTDSVGRSVIKSKRKLGFLSFLLNAESLKWLYTNYLCSEGAPSHHLLTDAFSLDPLDLFLGALQEASGSSRNPTCAVFQAAYHKLLAGYSLAPGSPRSGGWGRMNCLDIARSRWRDLTLGSVRAQSNLAAGRTTGCPGCAGFLSHGSALSSALTDPPSIARAAGFVAERLASSLQCQACLASLFESDESRPRCGAVLYVRKSGGVSVPSASVYRITRIAEQVLHRCSKGGDGNRQNKLWHLSLQQEVFQELLGESSLFPTLTNHFLDGELYINNHYTTLVQEITRCYFKTRMNHAKHLHSKYPCGRHSLKRLKGNHLFLSPPGSCQTSQTHPGS
ncbi:THAP9 transposase, partial [Halcyon senegalensis]|nr:THAP9 transposase [Halcyon senegalensis]